MEDGYESVSSSFRDPSGQLFYKNGNLYRLIKERYREHYQALMDSGLYARLVDENLLVSHKEIDINEILPLQNNVFKLIHPEIIPFISYPYEWCFSQLKDAALATLRIQKIALEYGMSLKDASAYNIQFMDGRPVLIDTLSFERYKEGSPWVAYRQFCQHFLAPLALMGKKDIRLNQLLRIYIDGIPLDLASKLLPKSSFMSLPLFMHIYLHAKTQSHFADRPVDVRGKKLSKLSLMGIIENLEKAVKKLNWKPKKTEWSDYYEETNYSNEAFEHKKIIVAEYLDIVRPKSVWDLGANTGVFARLASSRGINTVAFDIDPAAVEKNYLEMKIKKETNLLPLVLDLTNPSPSLGWANEERMSLVKRGPVDMVFALALIHHLAISNNLPFEKIASFFNKLCNYVIIEFVPKEDSQVQKLLRTREDIFNSYSQKSFEDSFQKYFKIIKQNKVRTSARIIYLMEKK